MSTEKKQSEKHENKSNKVFEQIIENYSSLNQAMVREIELASIHAGTTGGYREEMWMKFFRTIIPLKYSLAQGVIIIDSRGRCSREVDIAVYDEQYTPYVFQYNALKFIPIEAVAVAIECKSQKLFREKLEGWAKSILELEPRASGIARMVSGYVTGITNTTQQRTRPILILASAWKRKSKHKSSNLEKLGDTFDFILVQQSIKGEQQKFELYVKNEGKKLGWWGQQLNNMAGPKEESKKEPKEEYLNVFPPNLTEGLLKNAKEEYRELKFNDDLKLENTLADLRITGNELLTLNFQLNQLLMLLNNPMLFPHFAYAKRFKEIAKGKGYNNADVGGEPDE